MIFVDMGALLGRYLKRDQHHGEATLFWKRLEGARTPLVTSNFVLDEAITLLARRGGYGFAAGRSTLPPLSPFCALMRAMS